MKRSALLLVLAVACRSVPVSDIGLSGGATPRAAVDRFVAGARAQDIQAVGAIFGDDKGPRRDRDPRPTLERQLLIQLHCLRHEKSNVSGPARGEGGRQVFTVDLTQGKLEASVPFTVVKGPSDRWYVEGFDIVLLQHKGFCDKASG